MAIYAKLPHDKLIETSDDTSNELRLVISTFAQSLLFAGERRGRTVVGRLGLLVYSIQITVTLHKGFLHHDGGCR